MGGGGGGGGGPPAVPSGYVNCPHCNRNFNETAGARHIPKCKDTVNKPKRQMANSRKDKGFGGKR